MEFELASVNHGLIYNGTTATMMTMTMMRFTGTTHHIWWRIVRQRTSQPPKKMSGWGPAAAGNRRRSTFLRDWRSTASGGGRAPSRADRMFHYHRRTGWRHGPRRRRNIASGTTSIISCQRLCTRCHCIWAPLNHGRSITTTTSSSSSSDSVMLWELASLLQCDVHKYIQYNS